MENVIYDMKNQPKKSTLKYDKEIGLCIGVAKGEILDDKITSKCCMVFY